MAISEKEFEKVKKDSSIFEIVKLSDRDRLLLEDMYKSQEKAFLYIVLIIALIFSPFVILYSNSPSFDIALIYISGGAFLLFILFVYILISSQKKLRLCDLENGKKILVDGILQDKWKAYFKSSVYYKLIVSNQRIIFNKNNFVSKFRTNSEDMYKVANSGDKILMHFTSASRELIFLEKL